MNFAHFKLWLRYGSLIALGWLCVNARVRADDETSVPPPAPANEAMPVALGAYAEVFASHNFNRPDNGITAYRGFDNRSDTFTLANAVIEARLRSDVVFGRVALQVGHTPNTYYLAEPRGDAAGGVGNTNADTWKFIQEAYVGAQFGGRIPGSARAGIFLSPVGPESMAIKDNWNFSRSNLFYGLPFYHTGVSAEVGLSGGVSLVAYLINGWNSVVDNNRAKTAALQLQIKRRRLRASLLYMLGDERARHAAEGEPLRHLCDAHLTVDITSRVSLIAHLDAGREANRMGTSDWVAGALYARVRVHGTLFVAARVDAFREHSAKAGSNVASPIFFPAAWVSSGTLTVDQRIAQHGSVMLEARHDRAAGTIYFTRESTGTSAAPMARSQTTLTLGGSAWF